MSIFGYFLDSDQTTPAYDPGLVVACPFCLRTLHQPIVTTSVMGLDSERSYFYRAHKRCYEAATEEQIGQVEGSVL